MVRQHGSIIARDGPLWELLCGAGLLMPLPCSRAAGLLLITPADHAGLSWINVQR
jgi:hypothetical protein